MAKGFFFGILGFVCIHVCSVNVPIVNIEFCIFDRSQRPVSAQIIDYYFCDSMYVHSGCMLICNIHFNLFRANEVAVKVY